MKLGIGNLSECLFRHFLISLESDGDGFDHETIGGCVGHRGMVARFEEIVHWKYKN
jgi:hypothetical protein